MINGKAIYTTKGAANEYGRVGCNFYTGCPHQCEYCYLKRGITGPVLGKPEVTLKKCFKDEDNAYEVMKKEVNKHIDTLRQTGVFLSFTTDPLIPETRVLTLHTLEYLVFCGIPAKVLTKNAEWTHEQMAQEVLYNIWQGGYDVRFGFTLTGRDDMEPNASPNAERIATMCYLHDNNIKTWASIEPVIDWDSAERVIHDSIDFCDHYKIGLRSGVKKGYYDLFETIDRVTELVDFITEHGKTVYLKQSVQQSILAASMTPKLNRPQRDALMKKTVDMDGNPWGMQIKKGEH